jgi:uncharacterized protein with NRDE domain
MDSAVLHRKIPVMCVLVLLHRRVGGWPLVVGANRDEDRRRPASPPGLLEAGERRALAPRDRRANGTWLGFNDRGVFAALTNRPGAADATRPSRGELVPLALAQDSAGRALETVRARLDKGGDNPFRMVLTDGREAYSVANDGGEPRALEPGIHWLSNEHGLDAFEVPAIQALTGVNDLTQVVEGLRRALRDHEVREGHSLCKHGAERGTVSSSIVAIPEAGPLAAEFWFANGQPCEVEYQRYSNLTSRLSIP